MDDRVDLHMGELKQKRGFLRPGGFPSHHRLFRYQNGRMTWFWGTPILGTSTYPIQNHEHHLKKVCLYLLIDSIAGNVSRYAAVDSWKKNCFVDCHRNSFITVSHKSYSCGWEVFISTSTLHSNIRHHWISHPLKPSSQDSDHRTIEVNEGRIFCVNDL